MGVPFNISLALNMSSILGGVLFELDTPSISIAINEGMLFRHNYNFSFEPTPLS
jgi:hypothetical protein